MATQHPPPFIAAAVCGTDAADHGTKNNLSCAVVDIQS